MKKKSLFNIELYNNKHTPVGIIDNSWIEDGKITYKYMDVDEFNIQIPKKLSNGELNPIYNKVKSGQQLLVDKENGQQDRFYITSKKTVAGRKSFENKNFTCYQFQKKLEGIRIEISEGSYQLTNKIDETYISKGLFELIEENCNYKMILHDINSAYSNELVNEILDYNVNISKKYNVKKDNVIFDENVDFTVKKTENGSMPLYINIIYDDVKVEDTLNGTISYGTVYNDFDVPFYGNVNRIKCVYNDEAGNRNTLKYTFYYENGDIEEIVKPFVNAMGKNLIFGKKAVIKHTTGEKIKQNVMKYITFEECECSIMELLNDIQDKYDVVFEYDNINMEINCYGKETYGTVQPLELSLDSNCFEVTTEEAEDGLLATSIRVSGQEINDKQISIDNDNIFGGDIIYNYDYYINNGLLSDETVEIWNKYKRQLEINQDTWYELKDKANEVDDILITVEAEITSLNQKISYWNNLLSTYMVNQDSNPDDQTRIANEKKEFEDRLAELLLKRTILKDEYNELFEKISNFGVNNKRENIVDKTGNKIFTKEALEELCEIEKTEVYEDDYFVTNYSLYNYAVDKLNKIIYPTIDFDITSSNAKKYCKINKNIFTLGMKHDLDEELQELLMLKEVRLTEIEYNVWNDDYEKFSFSNAYKKTDLLNKVASLGRKSNRTASKVSDYTKVVSDASLSSNFVKSMYQSGLDTALATINGRGTTNKIDINSSGVWVIDCENENSQLYFGSSILGFTDDGWKTCKLAITPRGITAEYLVGKVLLGENLVIEGMNGCFYIGDSDKLDNEKKGNFGLYIFDKIGTEKIKRIFLGLQKMSDGSYQARLELYDKTGRKLVISDEGLLQTNSTSGYGYVGNDYPFYGYFYADEGINYVDSCKIRFRCGKLRSTTKGSSSGGDAVIQTTESGGGGTSEDGGGGTSYSGGGHHFKNSWTSFSWGVDGQLTSPTTTSDATLLNHDHVFSIPSHSHDFSVEISLDAHTHELPSHSHYINPHSHQINFNWTHTHEQIYGIWEGNTIASNVGVYVNGTLVRSGLNGTINEIEIKNYVKIGQWNEIKFTSTTDGSIAFDLFMKSFNLF